MSSSLSVLRVLGRSLDGVAESAGIEHVKNYDGEGFTLSAHEDTAVFCFRLPVMRRNVKVTGMQLSAARGSRARDMYDYLALEMRHAGRVMRGSQLLAILKGDDWLLDDEVTEQRLQELEDASVKLMTQVDRMRKELAR